MEQVRRIMQATVGRLGRTALALLLLLVAELGVVSGQSPEALPPCARPGWFPANLSLKDHTVFYYDGAYYLAAIYLGSDGYEDRLAYATSPDLCQWQDLGGILEERVPGEWDEFRVWAPYVYQESGVYYLFYTGVTQSFAQSIMLATSTDPADPVSWQRQGVVFQPDHPGSVWDGFDTWSDCRDPTVVRLGDVYYLYYTGLDAGGGIVGLATAPVPTGPWTDWGAVLTQSGAMLESATLAPFGGLFYLFYHQTVAGDLGEAYRYGPTPAGPWTEPLPFHPGWAHEIWTGQGGDWFTSFLTDYTVTIRPLTWDGTYSPARPFIGAEVHRVWLPLVTR